MSIHSRIASTMTSDRFSMTVNLPNANKSGNRRLPPHAPTQTYLCDDYICPSNWIESSGRMASYFIEVAADKAMWLDFTDNQHDSHDVAIVISVQGINTITGLPQGEPHLEQYIDSCPKCKVAFQANRFCSSCGYKWPKQNYLASTSGKTMWIDGFRALDGVIRQYVFTEETAKGVAAGIIGDQRVYAIGVAFFTSKNPKPRVERIYHTKVGTGGSSLMQYKKVLIPDSYSVGAPHLTYYGDNCVLESKKVTRSIGMQSLATLSNSEENTWNLLTDYDGSGELICSTSVESASDQRNLCMSIGTDFDSTPKQLVKNVKLEVGAGNEIDQEIGDDPNTLDYWNIEPSALLCVNYCNSLEMQNILSNKKHIQKATQGFLSGVPVA